MVFGVADSGKIAYKPIIAASLAAAFFLASVTDSDARRRKKRHVYASPYAAIVLDANSGRVLHAVNADRRRFPASITKVMTLYLLFEQLENRKLSMKSRIVFSRNAARQPPSKLRMRVGSSISVRQAILALVTKSANDVAYAVAEAIGGTEANFAAMMTAKARALGMRRTNFANASGLPNRRQLTTARDLTKLGRAIQQHFPQYYGFFSVRKFRFGRTRYRNHNKLLGRVRGVDGIKTGYTRASGFNLLTSARKGRRHIIAVVLGGRSSRIRNAIMTRLVAKNINRGSSRRTLAAIPKARGTRRVRTAKLAPNKPVRVASLNKQAAKAPVKLSAYASSRRQAKPAVVLGRSKPHHLIPTASIPARNKRRTVAVIDGSTYSRAAAASAASRGNRTATPSLLRRFLGRSQDIRPARLIPPAPIARPLLQPVVRPRVAAPLPPPSPVRKRMVESKTSAKAPAEAVRPAKRPSGVVIQVGATDDLAKAKKLLSKAKVKSRGVLSSAKPYTMTVRKNGETFYRARFAGLNKRSAKLACRTLKRSGLGCFTARY